MGQSKGKSLEERFDLLHPKVVRAVRAAHEALERLGIRHVLAGGLAVGAHGRPRLTKDVDFLVGAEAFEAHGTLVTFRPGVPLAAEGVPIDSLLPPEEHRELLEPALAEPVLFDGVPVIAPHYLVLMKLLAGRRQDLADVASMLEAESIDLERTRALLDRAGGTLRASFEALVAEHEAE